MNEAEKPFFFDVYVLSAGPHCGEVFRRGAELQIAGPEMAGWATWRRGWITSLFMVRTALHFCERHRPGLYHGFLTALLRALAYERARAGPGEAQPGYSSWFKDDSFLRPQNGFMDLAESLLAEPDVGEPLSLAYALFGEGLRMCARLAPDLYPSYLLAIGELVMDESDRAENRLPEASRAAQRPLLRGLSGEFNVHTYGYLLAAA